MGEIPEHILKTAQKAFADAIANCRANPMGDPPAFPIARAILAERERCAKLVASLASEYQRKSDDTGDEVERLIFYNIAEIIAIIPTAIRTHVPSPKNNPTQVATEEGT